MNRTTPKTPITQQKSDRYRRNSKPTPPEREAQSKKPNMTSSPSFSVNPDTLVTQYPSMSTIDPCINAYIQHASTPMQPNISLPPPASFALQPSDLGNIVSQIRTMLHDEIQNTIHNLIKVEIENAVKNAFKTFKAEIESLKAENAMLHDDLDALEQYGRRDLMRFGGIAETKEEDTTTIVTKIVEAIDDNFQAGDILRSHRVGNPNRADKSGRKLPPRQIIVRVRDPLVKRRILKCTGNLKNHPNYSNVNVNEDLTKTRNLLAYMARKLKTAGHIKQTWTVDGKIFLKNRNDRISTVTTELQFNRFMQHNCPQITRDFFFSDPEAGKQQLMDFAGAIPTTLSYAAATAAAAAVS